MSPTMTPSLLHYPEVGMHTRTSGPKLVQAAMVLIVAAMLTTPWVSDTAAAEDLKIYGTAIQGYDPVAYFTEGRAMKGDPDIHHEWNEARWHFATRKHRDMFAADPEKYAPNHGGF